MSVPEQLAADVLARRTQLPKKPDPAVLTGRLVELRPLDPDRDAAQLHAVTCGAPFTLGDRSVGAYDPDECVWRWMRSGPFRDVAAMHAYLVQRDRPEIRLFTACDRATGTPIGASAYTANMPEDLRVEIGSVWYGPIAQGTGHVREAVGLLLERAFALGYRRVAWKCDALNERSRRSALSYGFTLEGIQRSEMIMKGRNRDTAWFAVLDREWPAVRSRTLR
jgi:RimJ/RimL family protein N-acetyltransferase